MRNLTLVQVTGCSMLRHATKLRLMGFALLATVALETQTAQLLTARPVQAAAGTSTRTTSDDGWRRTASGWQWFPSQVSTVGVSEQIHFSNAAAESALMSAEAHLGSSQAVRPDIDQRSHSLFRFVWPAALAGAELLLILWCLEFHASHSTKASA